MTKPEAEQGNIIWLYGAKGDDTNDGLSQDKPVKSIDKALELAGEGGTIMLLGNVTIRDGNDLLIENVTLKRACDDSDYLLHFIDCENITFDNVVASYIPSTSYSYLGIYVQYATLSPFTVTTFAHILF